MLDGVWTHNPGNVNRILSIGLLLITLVSSISLISCGGGSSAGPPPPPPPSAGGAIGSSTVTVTGTSGAITHSVTFPLTITSVAPFSIHVSPTALSLTPGTSATVQVSLTVNSGTAPQLFVSVSGPPNSAGINMSSPQSLLTPTNPVSFFINPTSLAQPLQHFPVVITAADSLVSRLNSSVFTLPLTVSVPFSSNTTPTRSTFFRTDKAPTGMVY